METPGITVSDVRRAILNGGDVASVASAWHKALHSPLVPSLPLLDTAADLVEASALLQPLDKQLENLVAAWVTGKSPQLSTNTNCQLTVIGVPPYGHNAGSYLERVISEIKPDVICLDVTPISLSAHMLYTFSLSCAIGMASYSEIAHRESGRFYGSENLYPGNPDEIAILKGWLTKIPVLPVGMPYEPKHAELSTQMGFVDDLYVDRELSKTNVITSYRDFDTALENTTSVEAGSKITRQASRSLLAGVGTKMREALVEEGCYVASRIMEVAALMKKNPRVLAIIDITRCADTEYALSLLAGGVSDEVYSPPVSYALPKDLGVTGHHSEEIMNRAKELTPETTLTQQLFAGTLQDLNLAKDSELISEADADTYISHIAFSTRYHPEITHGASVRGSIAFKEVLLGLGQIEGGLTRPIIRRAALITLPPRIKVKQGASGSAFINDIVKEVLYDIKFSPSGNEATAFADWQSSDEILKNLKNLKPVSPEQMKNLPQRKIPAVVAEAGRRRAQNIDTSKMKLGKGMTRQALERMLGDLEEKLKSGQISEAEYNAEKERLTNMFKNAAASRSKMSSRELASTIMELMDAQDKQWGSELSFERMHVYYHIKAAREGSELSAEKRDYYGLKMLIDNLGEQGIIKSTEADTGFTLTGEALDGLLDYLIDKDQRQSINSAKGYGRTPVHERKHEVRRYNSGDAFRDISVRHTLKEVARQRKELTDVRRSDFRVFMKQRRKQQSDIVLCLDTSGSMGFHHKLMFARLAAIGIAKAAVENGDRVGVVAFDNATQTILPITAKDKESIVDYISQLFARGNTNIGDGIRCATDLLSQGKSQNQKYIVLVTDGQPTAISQQTFERLKVQSEKDLTEESAVMETRKAAARGIKLSVVHVANRNEPSGEFIRSLARAGRGKVRRMSGLEDLGTIMHG